jgi:hypothetical protein
MADVCQKAVSANDENAGNAIVHVAADGTITKLTRSIFAANRNPIARLNAWLDDRMDNPTYYTA